MSGAYRSRTKEISGSRDRSVSAPDRRRGQRHHCRGVTTNIAGHWSPPFFRHAVNTRQTIWEKNARRGDQRESNNLGGRNKSVDYGNEDKRPPAARRDRRLMRRRADQVLRPQRDHLLRPPARLRPLTLIGWTLIAYVSRSEGRSEQTGH
uniref:Uncharacterized protein n=1 Tax=Plectus sambesii TaxID=2011161 RepID=A0A914UKL1_9BILA